LLQAPRGSTAFSLRNVRQFSNFGSQTVKDVSEAAVNSRASGGGCIKTIDVAEMAPMSWSRTLSKRIDPTNSNLVSRNTKGTFTVNPLNWINN